MAQQFEFPIEEEPTDIPAIATEVQVEVPTDEVAPPEVVTPDIPVPVETPPDTAVPASAPSTSPDLDVERRKLEQAQRQHEALLQRDQTIRALESEAMQMERQLIDRGSTEEDAQRQTFTHLQGRVNQIQSAQQSQLQSEQSQGKRNASVHFAKKYNLTIDNLGQLERANTPGEMESIAKTMSNMVSKDKEIAELKARLAPQQSFDSNSPTPAAATSDDRLLDAYLNGDRSEAATAAAAKLLGM